MIDLELSWRAAAITAACLGGASVAVRRAARLPRPPATAGNQAAVTRDAGNQAGQNLAGRDQAGRDQASRDQASRDQASADGGTAGPWPRRLAMAAGIAQEAAILLALFALWQLAGSFSLIGPDGALTRAQWIWHAERVVHLPSETEVQRAFLGHPLLVQAFNLYYASLHFVVLIGCLVWVYARHRRNYPDRKSVV